MRKRKTLTLPKAQWTLEESRVFKLALERYEVGKWNEILKDPTYARILSKKTASDLKAKWQAFDQQAKTKKKELHSKSLNDDPYSIHVSSIQYNFSKKKSITFLDPSPLITPRRGGSLIRTRTPSPPSSPPHTPDSEQTSSSSSSFWSEAGLGFRMTKNVKISEVQKLPRTPLSSSTNLEENLKKQQQTTHTKKTISQDNKHSLKRKMFREDDVRGLLPEIKSDSSSVNRLDSKQKISDTKERISDTKEAEEEDDEDQLLNLLISDDPSSSSSSSSILSSPLQELSAPIQSQPLVSVPFVDVDDDEWNLAAVAALEAVENKAISSVRNNISNLNQTHPKPSEFVSASAVGNNKRKFRQKLIFNTIMDNPEDIKIKAREEKELIKKELAKYREIKKKADEEKESMYLATKQQVVVPNIKNETKTIRKDEKLNPRAIAVRNQMKYERGLLAHPSVIQAKIFAFLVLPEIAAVACSCKDVRPALRLAEFVDLDLSLLPFEGRRWISNNVLFTILERYGTHIKRLSLRTCSYVTDKVIQRIIHKCPQLILLNILGTNISCTSPEIPKLKSFYLEEDRCKTCKKHVKQGIPFGNCKRCGLIYICTPECAESGVIPLPRCMVCKRSICKKCIEHEEGCVASESGGKDTCDWSPGIICKSKACLKIRYWMSGQCKECKRLRRYIYGNKDKEIINKSTYQSKLPGFYRHQHYYARSEGDSVE